MTLDACIASAMCWWFQVFWEEFKPGVKNQCLTFLSHHTSVCKHADRKSSRGQDLCNKMGCFTTDNTQQDGWSTKVSMWAVMEESTWKWLSVKDIMPCNWWWCAVCFVTLRWDMHTSQLHPAGCIKSVADQHNCPLSESQLSHVYLTWYPSHGYDSIIFSFLTHWRLIEDCPSTVHNLSIHINVPASIGWTGFVLQHLHIFCRTL